jgi:pleiotropic regulator 1
LAAGKTMVTLTHDKTLYARSPFTQQSIPLVLVRRPGITSRSAKGAFFFNFGGHNAIINTISVNSEEVFFSGGMRLFIYSAECKPG